MFKIFKRFLSLSLLSDVEIKDTLREMLVDLNILIGGTCLNVSIYIQYMLISFEKFCNDKTFLKTKKK